MRNVIKPYTGSLTMKGLSGNPIARRAMTAINHQRVRCNNKKHPYYKWYGAKGIRVEYQTRDFIGWYIANIKLYRGPGLPTVGRIDHSKGYRLDNIRFESREDNTREMTSRLNREFQRRKVVAIDGKTGRVLGVSGSIKEAAARFGKSVHTVSRHLNGHFSRRRTRTGPVIGIIFREK